MLLLVQIINILILGQSNVFMVRRNFGQIAGISIFKHSPDATDVCPVVPSVRSAVTRVADPAHFRPDPDPSN